MATLLQREPHVKRIVVLPSLPLFYSPTPFLIILPPFLSLPLLLKNYILALPLPKPSLPLILDELSPPPPPLPPHRPPLPPTTASLSEGEVALSPGDARWYATYAAKMGKWGPQLRDKGRSKSDTPSKDWRPGHTHTESSPDIFACL